MVHVNERINCFVTLGKIFKDVATKEEWTDYSSGLNQSEFDACKATLNKASIFNPWFDSANLKRALLGLSYMLEEDKLRSWLDQYNLTDTPKNVGIIMAGNIPLVGFHDVLCVALSGHNALIKLSSEDQLLWPMVLELMSKLSDDISYMHLVVDRMKNFDAVIATGSDNSARYFESYFGHVPNIIRKNRTSVAILTGDEDEAELRGLGDDIFAYFGLGCRNVSKIFIPQDYDLDTFFKGIYEHKEVINHNKYVNNYDYNKAIYLMNQEPILENGFLILRETTDLNSPLAVMFYQRYQSESEVESYLKEHQEKIQAVVGKNYIPFGAAQLPDLADYADGVDTMKFLEKLA